MANGMSQNVATCRNLKSVVECRPLSESSNGPFISIAAWPPALAQSYSYQSPISYLMLRWVRAVSVPVSESESVKCRFSKCRFSAELENSWWTFRPRKKKKLPPPPSPIPHFAANTLPAPHPPPPGDPPFLGFSIKPNTPSSAGASDSPFPLPEQKKNKKYPKRPPRIGQTYSRWGAASKNKSKKPWALCRRAGIDAALVRVQFVLRGCTHHRK